MILYTAEMMKPPINIVFFDGTKSQRQLYCGTGLVPGRDIVVIYWVAHSHFEPIVEVNSSGKMVKAKWGWNSKFGRNIRQQYNAECGEMGMNKRIL